MNDIIVLIGLIVLYVVVTIGCAYHPDLKEQERKTKIESMRYDQVYVIAKGFYGGHKIRVIERKTYYTFAGYIDDTDVFADVTISDIFGLEEP